METFEEMKTKIFVLMATLFLTGCSAPTPESKPEYDEVELMVYQICINKVIDNAIKDKPDWSLVSFRDVERATEKCKDLKPEKK